jgi:UTP--glucose-1-phosphate uridylyltransferase
VSSDLVNIEGLIEKPHPSVAPSNLAVAGRYVLTPAVFDKSASNRVVLVERSS